MTLVLLFRTVTTTPPVTPPVVTPVDSVLWEEVSDVTTIWTQVTETT